MKGYFEVEKESLNAGRLMSKIGKAFGFFPEPPKIDTGVIGIRHLSQLDKVVEEVLYSEQGTAAGYTVPPQQIRDFMSDRVR